MTVQEILSGLDGLAGLAALINGALLWPVVRALKGVSLRHDRRIGTLERVTLDKSSRKSHPGRTRRRRRGNGRK